MIKPVTVASVLTKPGELRDTGTRPPNNNRFSMLRDRSRSVSISGRLPSPSPGPWDPRGPVGGGPGREKEIKQ